MREIVDHSLDDSSIGDIVLWESATDDETEKHSTAART